MQLTATSPNASIANVVHCHPQSKFGRTRPLLTRPGRATAFKPVAAATAGVKLDSERSPWERKTQWPEMWEYFRKQGFESVPPKLAHEMTQSENGGWVLIDIRPAGRYNDSHPAGAKNVQLFKETDFKKTGVKGWIRAAAFMANGVQPVEPNEDFVEELTAAADGRGVILMCDIGGTLIPNENFPCGKISRSLKAAYQLIANPETGFPITRVVHLKRGIYGWHLDGLPFDGEYNSAGIGRTPSVVEEQIFSYGRETHIIEPSDMDPPKTV